MIKMNDVEGNDKGKISIYALSTCAWCTKTKNFLKSKNIGFSFVDVDLLSEDEKNEAMKEVKKWNERGSLPTLIINDSFCIVGFDYNKIMEVIA